MSKKATKTSSFGISKRESHDSSGFYNSKLYSNVIIEPTVFEENEVSKQNLNKIFCKSSEKMNELPDNSIHLAVTSPPYNVGKEYDKDLSLEEHLSLIGRVLSETYKKLMLGGRICINVANLGRKPYIPINSYITQTMLDIGFLMRAEIIWNKAASAGTSCAWGSWLSASNPALRDVHEYILVFSKGKFLREKNDREDTIEKNEFLEYTKSIWTFPTESARRVGHPAPFPIELPYRCIQLYTFKGDVVLDPFMGSGTTALAAIRTARNFIGYDNNKDYVKNAKKRIKFETDQTKIF